MWTSAHCNFYICEDSQANDKENPNGTSHAMHRRCLAVGAGGTNWLRGNSTAPTPEDNSTAPTLCRAPGDFQGIEQGPDQMLLTHATAAHLDTTTVTCSAIAKCKSCFIMFPCFPAWFTMTECSSLIGAVSLHQSLKPINCA